MRHGDHSKVPVLRVQHSIAVLPEALDHTKAPAEPLLHELFHRFGRFRIGNGLVTIPDHVTTAMQAHREVAILCQGITGESSCFYYRILPEGADGPRYYGYAIKVIESPSVEILRGDIF